MTSDSYYNFIQYKARGGNDIGAIAATYMVNGLQDQPMAYDISCAATSLALPRLGLLSDKFRKSNTRNLGMSPSD